MCLFVVLSVLLTCVAVTGTISGTGPAIWIAPILCGYLPLILTPVIRKRRKKKFWEMHENSVMNATIRAHSAINNPKDILHQAEEKLREAENIKRQAEEAWRHSNQKNKNNDFDLSLEQCYAFLGITSNTTIDEIKAIYRELMIEFHPDKHKSHKKHYEEHCQKINYAYEKICNERGM